MDESQVSKTKKQQKKFQGICLTVDGNRLQHGFPLGRKRFDCIEDFKLQAK